MNKKSNSDNCEKQYKQCHFKMESQSPSQRKCLAHLTPQMFGRFEWGKITFGLGQSNMVFQTTICKANKKADILRTGPNIKDIV